MITVITPVGTSLFTNYLKKNGSDATFSRHYSRIEELPASDWDNTGMSRAIASLKTSSEHFIRTVKQSAAAELQSTAKIQNELKSDITVHLFASDTIASRLAAEILRDQINYPNNILGNRIQAVFNADPSTGQIDVILNLQVQNSNDFSRDGMPNLFHRINYIKDWEAGGSQNLTINITGGYGATLPYLTIFGQLESVPLYYNFEDSDKLIVIPQAPLAIDWNLIEKHYDVLTQIDKGIEASDWPNFKKDNYEAVEELDAFIWWDNSVGACLSPIGVIFWDQYLKNHFIVDLANSITRTPQIDNAIQDLYRRLNLVLRPHHLNSPDCYNKICGLGPSDDLNHTGQVAGVDIFIFKSTDEDQIRLMYTFEVNGRAITRIKIYDQRPHQNTLQYDVWKEDMRCNHSTIVFDTHTFDVQTES